MEKQLPFQADNSGLRPFFPVLHSAFFILHFFPLCLGAFVAQIPGSGHTLDVVEALVFGQVQENVFQRLLFRGFGL